MQNVKQEKKELIPGDSCPNCEFPLQFTQEGDALEGEGFDLWCPNCKWTED